MRSGVWLCTCGGTLAERLRFDALREAARAAGASVGEHALLCSAAGLAALEAALRADPPDRVVIAACSPREHGAALAGAVARAGLSPTRLQRADLREQVAWVTPDLEAATAKGSAALRGALARAAGPVPAPGAPVEVETGVMVIGAGTAGIAAAQTLLEAGRAVVLVERAPFVGGLGVRLGDVFPGLECGACVVQPAVGSVVHAAGEGRLELLTEAEVESVHGRPGRLVVGLRQRPQVVDPATCIGCGACSEVCPASGPDPFEASPAPRPAIGPAWSAAQPWRAWWDAASCTRAATPEPCTACVDACPVPGTIDFTATARRLERTVGAVILAIGAGPPDPAALAAAGLGRAPGVVTAWTLERWLADDAAEVPPLAHPGARRVAFVHGDPAAPGAALACAIALKQHEQLARRFEDLEVRHHWRVPLLDGPEHAARYARLRALPGTRFLEADAPGPLDADLVVLALPPGPAPDAARLAALFGVDLDAAGFLAPVHPITDPVRTRAPNVLLAGSCAAPRDLATAVAHGQAAAAHALAALVPGRALEVALTPARVDPVACSRCGVCAAACAHGALRLAPDGRAEVDALSCRACGLCAATCPAGAIRATGVGRAARLAELAEVLA